MSSSNHPLPPPPPAHQQQYHPQRAQQQQQQTQQTQQPFQQRPRATSNFSFHSRKSSGSAGKIDYRETHEEKESRRLHSKADPSMALSEAEPSAVAAREKTSLVPIRSLQYRDSQGNVISDPDRSNPTRSRWERPLDTIRSFEAAIDGNYKRQSYMRAESAEANNFTRRSSYFGGSQANADERPRYQNGYYGGARSQSHRPESYMDRQNPMGRPDSYYDHHGGPSNGYVPNRARYPRTASEPQFNNSQSVYPAPGAHHSYETVTTASGSGSSADQAGYSTNPSSGNSSVDRIAPLPVKDNGDSYGFNGFGNTPTPGFNSYSMSGGGGNGGPTKGNQGPPLPPHKDNNGPRVPMKLGKSSSNERPAPAEKRKSWFGKRFSKA